MDWLRDTNDLLWPLIGEILLFAGALTFVTALIAAGVFAACVAWIWTADAVRALRSPPPPDPAAAAEAMRPDGTELGSR